MAAEGAVDNLTHTLAGATLAQSGLKRMAPFGTVMLLIGANLPDFDVLAYLFGSGMDALAFRRGWTHGVLAMAVLPLALAGAVLAISRRARSRPLGVLLLAAIGVWSHPLLDLLNVYGVRLLMPFSGRWFYGDALFIIDPWVWLLLTGGLLLAWRRGEERNGGPPRVVLAVLAGYAVVMAGSGRMAAKLIERETGVRYRTMVAPSLANPFRRRVIRDLGDRFETGSLRVGPRSEYLIEQVVPVGRDLPGAAIAQNTHDGRRFLAWARFPWFHSRPSSASSRDVTISDLRFGPMEGGWASVRIRVGE